MRLSPAHTQARARNTIQRGPTCLTCDAGISTQTPPTHTKHPLSTDYSDITRVDAGPTGTSSNCAIFQRVTSLDQSHLTSTSDATKCRRGYGQCYVTRHVTNRHERARRSPGTSLRLFSHTHQSPSTQAQKNMVLPSNDGKEHCLVTH